MSDELDALSDASLSSVFACEVGFVKEREGKYTHPDPVINDPPRREFNVFLAASDPRVALHFLPLRFTITSCKAGVIVNFLSNTDLALLAQGIAKTIPRAICLASIRQKRLSK